MQLYQRSQLRQIKNDHDFRFTKSLGQNFLISEQVVNSIIDETDIKKDDLIIEIGPGMGTLTVLAAQRAGRVAAIEIDPHLLPVLDETLAGFDNTRVINADILKTDLSNIISEERKAEPELKDVKVIGNLPYYITTPIIMKILRERVPVKSLTVMMQKEVADRINAGPGSRQYGAISAAVQYYCHVSEVCDAPAACFEPKPKVDSKVLLLSLRKEKAVSVLDEELFFGCIKAGFSKRRKTLANGLCGFAGLDKENIKKVIEQAGVDPARRAETLSLQEFADIANLIKRRTEAK